MRRPTIREPLAAVLIAASGAHAQCDDFQECQSIVFSTAYTSRFPIAESITPSFNGRIRTLCLEGFFWDGGALVDCTPSDKWRLNVYRDDAGLPGILIYTYEAGTPDANMTVSTAPTGSLFSTFTVMNVSFSGLSIPVDGGQTYHFELIDSGDPCIFRWISAAPGDGVSLLDADSDGYSVADQLDDDLTICFAATVGYPCSFADVTTQGAGAGDKLDGIADGIISAADLNFFVNDWVQGDLGLADITTQGAGENDPGYGIPDGNISGADINFYVNEWIKGCN